VSAPGGDLVEDYLDQLYARLRCAPRDARRILAEAEDHLREAVSDGLAAGLTETEAQQRNGAPARGSLTIQQAEAVRDACERYARTLGMKADKSELLAKAVLGSLTETDGG